MVTDPKLIADYQLPVKVFDDVMSYLHKVHRPAYLGEISAEVGWNVERTEQVVDILVASGSIRPATDEEKMGVDAPKDANLYVLNVDRDISMAFKP